MNIYYHMGEPQKYYAKRKKSDAKDYIQYNSIYMKCPKDANLQSQKMEGMGID